MEQQGAASKQENLKVPHIISEDKWNQFKYKLIGTLIGMPTIGHYGESKLKDEDKLRVRIVAGIMSVLVPLLIIIPSTLITSYGLHAVAVLIPGLITPISSVLADLYLKTPKKAHKYIMTAIYSYLWSAHLFIANQLLQQNIISSIIYAAILIFSIVSVITSASTISFAPVRQLSASTLHFQDFGIHSTLYMRLYIALPLLLTQVALFYSPSQMGYHLFLPHLSFVISLIFLTWVMGWLSSLYNTVMFLSNNVLNCLIFGEQLTHSGHNYRGNSACWISFLSLGLNILAIGLNVAFVASLTNQGRSLGEIVQSQHYFLVAFVCMTSFITSAVVYLSYRINIQKKHLIRYGQYNLAQAIIPKEGEKKIRLFFGHRQVFMMLITFIIPITISLVATYALSHFVSAYGNGSKYDLPNTFLPQKLTTAILLGINTIAYFILILLKQLTRTRSKLGCKINICFDKYYAQYQRDMFIKLALKITGSLAIMALVLRIQNPEIITNYILMLTPISPSPNSHLYFFIYYILLPVLIYRSYKRSQTFSHWFHITIFISLILTIIDSQFYFYESIFVVLAVPNFPSNAFKLLITSPFTIPQKLAHKNQGLYRIGYLLVNLFTLFIYTATCGTMQFTMVFGLPVYWCVVPTINCQNQKPAVQKSLQNNGGSTKSTFFNEGQFFNVILVDDNIRSTPEHNLYEKIISQIPFNIFRNKKPGYYLLCIGKYIFLVEIIRQFYGIFQTVKLVGLQKQQVTNCQEGETINRIIQQTWGDNPKNRRCCTFNDTMKTVISGQAYIKQVGITFENEIQLTGLIQSNQFYKLFKKCLIKSLIFSYDAMLRKSSKMQLTQQQQKQAQELLDDLYIQTNKQKIEQYFSYEFIKGGNFCFDAKVKQKGKLSGKKQTTAQKDGNKQRKSSLINEFSELTNGSTLNKLQTSCVEQKNEKDIDYDVDGVLVKQNYIIPNPQNTKQTPKIEISQLHMAVIVTAYLAIIGKTDYLDIQRIYKVLRKDSSALDNFDFQGGLDLAADSVGCALKISLGKQMKAENNAEYSDFSNYHHNQFFGVMESIGFSEAIQSNKQDIWTVSYNQKRKELNVKKLTKNTTALYLLNVEKNAVEAVWNNLRFELSFAANQSVQRQSINLLVQGCERPYGNALYYSQQFLNL